MPDRPLPAAGALLLAPLPVPPSARVSAWELGETGTKAQTSRSWESRKGCVAHRGKFLARCGTEVILDLLKVQHGGSLSCALGPRVGIRLCKVRCPDRGPPQPWGQAQGFSSFQPSMGKCHMPGALHPLSHNSLEGPTVCQAPRARRRPRGAAGSRPWDPRLAGRRGQTSVALPCTPGHCRECDGAGEQSKARGWSRGGQRGRESRPGSAACGLGVPPSFLSLTSSRWQQGGPAVSQAAE